MFHLFRSEPSQRSHPALTNDLVHPPDVARRHAAVQKLRLLDTTPEERFDRCTRLLAASLHAPIALLTLMDAEREWLKSTHGWSTVRELSLHDSIGIHILGQDSHSFVVQDATKDTRFAGHPLVKGPEKIRFIAGQALSDVDGVKVGALYILDRQRRTLTAAEAQILADVALLAGQ